LTQCFNHAINPRILGQLFAAGSHFSEAKMTRRILDKPSHPLGRISFRRNRRPFSVNYKKFKVGITSFALLLIAAICWAQADKAPAEEGAATSIDIPGRFFDMKVPEGFKPQPVEEGGILKWAKDSGEIFLVVGDLFHESADVVFKGLRKAADQDKRTEEVRVLKIKGGRGLLYKEKPPEDPLRSRTWRLIVVTDKKMIDVEFSAPGKEFESFAPGFEKAVASFKLKTS
jgi:hypothetical protein